MIRRDFDKMGGRHFDVAVVGGGVYGIATALEAARRGLRPVLLERADFGGATSWNSLRILHGGLRYLQSLDIQRFVESVRERRWFCRHFPDLIRPLPCLMPIYDRGLKRRSALRTALRVNDQLARHRNCGVAPQLHLPDGLVLSTRETARWFPPVETRGLQGGALWYDAVMVNAPRVLMEMLRWACACGAEALNYVAVTELLTAGGQVRGVAGVDALTGRRVTVEATAVLNCAGPWASTLVRGAGYESAHRFVPSLAFNVLLDRPAMWRAAVAVQAPAPGSPVLFMRSWRGRVLAGTMHLPWHTADDVPPWPTESQVLMLLGQLNAAVPGLKMAMRDVRRVYAGLLPARRDGSAELARRPFIHEHGKHGDGPAGLVSVSGVKFTTARAVAERALRTAWRSHGGLPDYHTRSERPVTHPSLDMGCPDSVLRGDSVFTSREIARIVREEAAVYLDDLLLRRTDWACATSCETELAERADELLTLAGCPLRHASSRQSAH